MDRASFRDMLLFDIGFAIARNRALLRQVLKEHVTGNVRQQVAHSSDGDRPFQAKASRS